MAHDTHWTIRMALVAALAAALSAGCKEREVRYQPVEGGGDPQAELILRTYEVPGGYGQQVKSLLRSTFAEIRETVGARAELSPDGQLLVLGPAGIHEGVAELLEQMKGREAPPPPPTVGVRYWLVLGRPARGDGAQPFHDFDPKEIRPALDAITASQGPTEFWLLEPMQVRVLSDEYARTQGQFAQVGTRASAGDGKILVDVSVRIGNGAASQLETRLAVDGGQLVVLGQSGIQLDVFKPRPVPTDGPFTLFYIVRADVENAS